MIFAACGATAQAATVTLSGSGTVGQWYFFDDTTDARNYDVPAEVETAFPEGVPFRVNFTYDTDLVTQTDVYSPTFTWYTGLVTHYVVEAADHVITKDSSWGGIIGVLDDDPRFSDELYAAAGPATRIDGSDTFHGEPLNGSLTRFLDPSGSALSSTDLPAGVCLGAFTEIVTQFSVRFNGELYFVLGSGTPDRTLDSDADGPLDGQEIADGTNPCNADTDGDGLLDGVDPAPLVPRTASEAAADEARAISEDVLALPTAVFSGPNSRAQAGRQNALSNRLQAAANAVDDGDLQGALDILEHILLLLDGDSSPPDVMEAGPEKDALRSDVEALAAAIRAQL